MNGAQLKNSILQWAIQGKLVPQNPKDEPAQKLLEHIAASRNEGESSKGSKKASTSLRGAKATKQSKTLSSRIYRENGIWYEQVGTATPKDISDEIPFEIPGNWAWCRLSYLVSLLSDGIHGTPSYSDSGPYYFVNGNNLKDCRIIIKDSTKRVSAEEYEKYKKPLNENTILVSINGTIGNIGYYNNEPIILGKSACYFNLLLNDLKEYITTCLKSPYFLLYALENATGTTIKNVSLKAMNDFIIPLPPLAEQKRIVAKLEQVFPLAEEYGAAQEQLDKLNKELPEALKKSILQEAIQGKLVPQNPKDEPAQILLERIAAFRNESSLSLPKGTSSTSLRGAKATKQSKNPPSRIYRENGVWYEQVGTATPKDITDEIPFEIPETWAWCRLDNLGTFVRGNGIKRDETVSTGKPCVRYGEMYTTYRVKFSDIKSHTTSNIFDKCQKFHKDDILMALTGENKWDIALAAVYQGGEEVALGGDMCRFSPFESNSLYLVYLINSPYGIGYKRETSTGDIIVHTSVGKLGNFLVPLPPLAEQKRIVAKLEQLFKVL